MESLDECMQNIVIVIREEEKKSRRVKDVMKNGFKLSK
jgi:molecular chaperone GrpE (heat shock protein)